MLLSEDRTTLNLVLEVFLRTSPKGKDLWRTHHPFHCLHLIGPMLTPQDTIHVIESFGWPWSKTTGFQLCTFLQAQCRAPDHARIVVKSEVLHGLLVYLKSSRDFTALWVICILFETLSKMEASEFLGLWDNKALDIANDVLSSKMQEDGLETWNYYHYWGVPFSLAMTCYRLNRSHGTHIISSGILVTLHSLSTIASVSEFKDLKETQNFIHMVYRLVQRNKIYN